MYVQKEEGWEKGKMGREGEGKMWRSKRRRIGEVEHGGRERKGRREREGTRNEQKKKKDKRGREEREREVREREGTRSE